MPEAPDPKPRPHPFRLPPAEDLPSASQRQGTLPYAELDVTTNYSFLRGASHPEEMVEQAAALGMTAIGITDLHSLAGIVRAHVAAKQRGIQLVVGTRIEPTDADGLSLLLYPTDRTAYGRLCRLLTLGKRRAAKGQCTLNLDDIIAHAPGLLCVVVPPPTPTPTGTTPDALQACTPHIARLRTAFNDDRLSIAIRRQFGADDEAQLSAIAAWAGSLHIPLVATNATLYHTHERRPLQDVLTCIRLHTTVEQAGYSLLPNGERHLKTPTEMHRLFAGFPGAIARTLAIARRVSPFNLDQIRYEYPHEVVSPGSTPMQHLRDLTAQGISQRYPDGAPPEVLATIEHELTLIDELNFPAYFLTVHDLVAFARSRGILCQGRGAAANSAVCYCLGVTSVDPSRISVLFERFISKERNEPPDIDIDFEHERREEVLQYIYSKYGRERAALTAEVISYRGKSAIRDVGKALGLSLDLVDRLAKSMDWWDGGEVDPSRLREIGVNPEDRTIRLLIYLCKQIMGFPRHLSQHVGGMVITNTPLCELVPIENAAMDDRTVIEWDKDDIDAMGMLKVDCLGLGMLTCIRKCFGLIEQHYGRALTLANIPPEDPNVYDLICDARTIGVFQIESRAQMAMLPRLRPRCFYDLVIEVAIVRPGPIQGKMVHPYLRRRNREEPITYPNDQIREVLGRTLGVPLFQEQAMKLAIVAGGFTPAEADELRRAIAAWKRKGDAIYRFGIKLVEGMIARGYAPDFAQRCFEQIKGFSEYGFPESHAASFALLVYVSCWLKTHYPAAFAAALINSQPMGFYQPAQIVRDAQEHGVTVHPIDINASRWDCTLEDGGKAIRLGMRLARSMSEPHAEAIAAERDACGPYMSVRDLHRRVRIPVAALRRLARADAFGSLGLDRQQALWQIRPLRDESLPLFDPHANLHDNHHAADLDTPIQLPEIPAPQLVREDYSATGLSLKTHPLAFLRPDLDRQRITPNRVLSDESRFPHGTSVRVAGLVLVRQRPGTASGIVFMTIEDESGIANLVVFPNIYDRFRKAARHSVAVLVAGNVERSGKVVHVRVRRIAPLSLGEGQFAAMSRDFH
ncbi:MAG: error-prone DNA polymerase [Phycisphaerales bacterium]|nr:error-prone DNA polymerase [Phycisphaerales bacterium]